MFLRRIAPAQAIAIDGDHAARHPPVINARLPWLVGKNGFKRSICASVSQKRLPILTPVSLGA
jgi:hypothetical protein